MNRFPSFAFLAALLVTATAAVAHNGPRIFLTVENNQLRTNFDNFQSGHNITSHVTVFRGEFGQDAESPIPNLTRFPGISGSITPGTALPIGSSVSFNILDAARYWDGTGNVLFGTSPETMSISSGLDVATTGAGAVPGFTLVVAVPGTEGWHTHPAYTLNPDGLNVYHDGVYLLQLSMSNNGLTIQPFYIVFGQNVDDAIIDRAVDFLNAAAVPEPASLAVLGFGGMLLLRRRRT